MLHVTGTSIQTELGAFNQFVETERPFLQNVQLDPPEAGVFVGRATELHSSIIGEVLEVVCGQLYTFINGRHQSLLGITKAQESDPLPLSGVVAGGKIMGFTTLLHHPQEVTVGAYRPAAEPCLIYEHVTAEPKTEQVEFYVPFKRLSHLALYPQDE